MEGRRRAMEKYVREITDCNGDTKKKKLIKKLIKLISQIKLSFNLICTYIV